MNRCPKCGSRQEWVTPLGSRKFSCGRVPGRVDRTEKCYRRELIREVFKLREELEAAQQYIVDLKAEMEAVLTTR